MRSAGDSSPRHVLVGDWILRRGLPASRRARLWAIWSAPPRLRLHCRAAAAVRVSVLCASLDRGIQAFDLSLAEPSFVLMLS